MKPLAVHSLKDIAGREPVDEYFSKAVCTMPIYRGAAASQTSANVEDICPVVTGVYINRLLQAEQLLQMMIDFQVEPFEAVVLESAHECVLIAPPVVEGAGPALLVHGSHRLYAARRAGLQAVTVLHVLLPAPLPPPCQVTGWSDIQLQDDNIPWPDRMSKVNWDLFRPIVTTPGLTQMKFHSLRELSDHMRGHDENYSG